MAKSVDNFSDLKELGIDCDSTELEEQFMKAADHLQTLLPNVNKDTLLVLYGYYKQGTEGPCVTPKPSWYDVKAKSKWESWNKLGDMPKTRAQMLYVEEIRNLDPNFDGGCKDSSSKEGWVTVSTLQQVDELKETDKSLVDFIKDGNREQAKKILSSYDTKQLSDAINRLDSEGLGLIHWAADRGSLEMLQMLISFGADVNQEDVDKQTPLHYASSCGHVDCVKFLLGNGANVHATDSEGLDAIAVANDGVIRDLLLSRK